MPGTGSGFVDKVAVQVMAKGHGKYALHEARRIAKFSLRRAGLIDRNENLTPKGSVRARLTPEVRAFQRAKLSAEDGGIYDPLENKVVMFG